MIKSRLLDYMMNGLKVIMLSEKYIQPKTKFGNVFKHMITAHIQILIQKILLGTLLIDHYMVKLRTLLCLGQCPQERMICTTQVSI